MGRALGKFKLVDFYRKMPTYDKAEGAKCATAVAFIPCKARVYCRDLTEASLSGAGISVIAAVVMVLLLGAVRVDTTA